MLSYFEEIRGAGVPAGCEPRELAERLIAASQRLGDVTDTQGRPDYLVRVVVNYDSPLPRFAPALILDAKTGGIDVIEQHQHGAPETVDHLAYDGPWLDEAERCYEEFRSRLAEPSENT
jgi:hypothetical protein